MYSTTGLAVGMAIGVPAFVFIVVFIAFWYRQKLRYKKDLRAHDGAEDYDEVNDLDLDHIIDTPKESHIKDFSSDNLVSDDKNNNNINIDDDDDDSNNNKSDSNLKRHNSLFGENGVIIKNGNYSIRKESKIMGLRMISKDIDNNNNNNSRQKNFISLNGQKNSNNSNKQRNEESNYKLYYESVIPVLPSASTLNNNGSAYSIDKEDMSMNPPKTPMKLNHNNSSSTNNNSSSRASNNELYKMLQDDSPFYPKSRITSTTIPETPFSKLSHHNSSASLAEMMKQSKQQVEQVFNSPANSTANVNSSSSNSNSIHNSNHNAIISPFDTPPAIKNKNSRMASRSIDDDNDDAELTDINHANQTLDTDNVKRNITNVFNQSIDYSDDDGHDSEIPHRHGDYESSESFNSGNNPELENSPIKKNLHRRINSAESRIILDENTNAAENSYNLKRKEWLDIYKKR